MTARHVLIAYLGTMTLYGLVMGLLPEEPSKSVDLVFTLALWVLPYVWYHRDADEQGFVRSTPWGAGMILLAIVTAPIYLARSRPPGRKLKALAGFLGVLVIALVLPLAAGTAAALWVNL